MQEEKINKTTKTEQQNNGKEKTKQNQGKKRAVSGKQFHLCFLGIRYTPPEAVSPGP